MKINRKDWFKQAKEKFGEDSKEWTWKCSGCNRPQSVKSISKQMSIGIPSKRHGLLKKNARVVPYCECYSSDCNWVAYGLFNSGILVIRDPTKPYDENTKENCGYVFPFAEEKAL